MRKDMEYPRRQEGAQERRKRTEHGKKREKRQINR
jgi:hypothetical protein